MCLGSVHVNNLKFWNFFQGIVGLGPYAHLAKLMDVIKTCVGGKGSYAAQHIASTLACCRLVVKQYALKQSVLEDVMQESSPPNDPLNGACQLGKTQPSPFSSRKVMYENEEVVVCSWSFCFDSVW